jgi:hypothetical protein
MTSPVDLKKILLLVPDKLSFNGSQALSQFNIIYYSFKPNEKSPRLSVEIVLQRIFSYHLTNTFIPTTSLLVLVEITLFFEKSQTELAIGLSLTIMLVMYTMYQSINEPLTKTAYLKMIDYWLLFCLLIPFVIFLIEINWLLNKKNEVQTIPKNRTSTRVTKISSSRKTLQYLVIGITCIFIALYVVVALLVYLKNSHM